MSDAAAAAATPSSGMKLVVDRASQRVLFAEAGKDVVDFIFGLLAMPLGGAASLLRAEGGGALGSVASVYASVEKMDAAYMLGPEALDALLVNDSLPSGPSTRLLPTTTSAAAGATSTSTAAAPASYCSSVCPRHGMPMPPLAAPTYMTCPYPYTYPAPAPAPENGGVALLPPPDAGLALLPPSLYRCHACYALGSPQGTRGFVHLARYTVMDDLTVAPATNVSTVALLRRLGVKDLDALEERTVAVGRKECLEILKVSLQSKTVLTDVFLAKTTTTNKRARTAGDKSDEEAVEGVATKSESGLQVVETGDK